MKSPREALSQAQRMFGLIGIAVICLGLTSMSGCQQGGESQATASNDRVEAAKATASPKKAAETTDAQVPTKQAETVAVDEKPVVDHPKDVLDKMVAAYKAAKSYADKGSIQIRVVEGGKPVDQSVDFTVAMVRPNKLRMNVYRGNLLCDGKDVYAFAQHLPQQVSKRSAPSEIGIRDIFADEILADALSQGPTMAFSWLPVQALLLLADKPLDTVVANASEGTLLPPDKIGENECHRVELRRPDGKAVLWIDRKSFVLRRLELPIDELNREAKAEGSEIQSLVADFKEAEFDVKIDDKWFQPEVPKGAEVVDYLKMPALLLLGKPAPAFSFTGLDGKKLDPETLKGKVAVIQFWSVDCGPCRITLPAIQKVARKYKDNDKVVFCAVSVDKKEVEEKALKEKFADLQVSLPIYRDLEQDAGMKMYLTGIPSLCLIGANGVIQDFQVGISEKFEADLTRKVESLLAGQDISREPAKLLADDRKNWLSILDKWIAKGVFNGPPTDLPELKIADTSQPKALKMSHIWSLTDIKSPGNLLAVPQPSGPTKLFVLESWKNVAEVGFDGKLIARHPLDIAEQEVVTFLRTAVDGAGKRFFVASGDVQQRLHVFDENWKLVSHFPADVQEKGKGQAGIADAQIADLDGDGKLEIVVAYMGEVGMQIASLDGKRLNANPSAAYLRRIALVPDGQGKRSLVCNNMSTGALLAFDAQLKAKGETEVPGRRFTWIVAEDLNGDGKSMLCGLHFVDPSTQIAVGLSAQGAEAWTYPLPKGGFERAPEHIVSGNLLGSGPAQWILPGPDGSVHIIGADGKPIDQFNCGASIAGVGAAVVDGRSILVVATAKGNDGSLEAWEVQGPEKAK